MYYGALTHAQQILDNFFEVNDSFRLVDLPGYGYAKISKAQSRSWGEMIEKYMESRPNLIKVFQLVDIRHDPSVQDIQMFEYLKYFGLDGIVVATKSDKISRNEMQKKLSAIRKILGMKSEDKLIPLSLEPLKVGDTKWFTVFAKNLQAGLVVQW